MPVFLVDTNTEVVVLINSDFMTNYGNSLTLLLPELRNAGLSQFTCLSAILVYIHNI